MTTTKKPAIPAWSPLAKLALSPAERERAKAQGLIQPRWPAPTCARQPRPVPAAGSGLSTCPDLPPPPSASHAMREQGEGATARPRAGLATETTPAIASMIARSPEASRDVLMQLPTAMLEFFLATGAIAIDSVTNAIVRVTPAIAHQWLQTNHNNRKPSATKIGRFASLMRDGAWTLTGEPIKFAVDGGLLDGQSRLRAILQADTAVLLEVRWGLPRAAQESMDTGEARSQAHQLQMAGVRYATAAAAALRMIWCWERGLTPVVSSQNIGGATRKKITNTTIREAYERHPGVIESIARYAGRQQLCHLMSPSKSGAYHYLFARVDRAKADAFWDGVASGVGLDAGSPIAQLRERLINDRLSQARMSTYEQGALIVKAWNAYHAGERLRSLTFRTKGVDPEAFPEIAGLARPEGGAS